MGISYAGPVRRFPRAQTRCLSLFCPQVSQVPLDGVLALLAAGNACGALTVLDVDVSPDVCVHEAELGSLDDLVAAVKLAQVGRLGS